jgi:hypothetical protein
MINSDVLGMSLADHKTEKHSKFSSVPGIIEKKENNQTLPF